MDCYSTGSGFNFRYLHYIQSNTLTLLVRRFQIYRTSYATFIFNVIKIVQKRLENGSFDGSRCVLYNAFVLARRIDLDVATICYFDKFMIFFYICGSCVNLPCSKIKSNLAVFIPLLIVLL